MRPDACTLIVCGDLERRRPSRASSPTAFAGWRDRAPATGAATATLASTGRRRTSRPGAIVVVDRPGAPQSEVRVGHVGAPGVIADFHALIVLNAILGGLFNSRLNRLLREERGYTYGVHSALRPAPRGGPVRGPLAVETDVTAPAVADIMAELARIREGLVEADELDDRARLPRGRLPAALRDRGPGRGGARRPRRHGLPDDELDRYRPAVAAVTRGRGPRGGDRAPRSRRAVDRRSSATPNGSRAASRDAASARWRSSRTRPPRDRHRSADLRSSSHLGPAMARPAAGRSATSRSGGLAAGVALAVAAAGVHVELVGSIGDDPDGDPWRSRSVGPASAMPRSCATPRRGRRRRSADGALLTEAGSLPRLDAADVELGLRYLPDCRVLVVATPLESAAWAAALEAAAYHGASVIAVVRVGRRGHRRAHGRARPDRAGPRRSGRWR